MSLPTKITLHNKVEMPLMGFGCAFGNWTDRSEGVFFGFTPETAWSAVPSALSAGYRLLDTALLYGTHTIVGQSLGSEFRAGSLKREDVFVVSKVFHGPSPVANNSLGVSVDIAAFLADSSLDIRSRIKHDYERCLAELNLGYLDLLLMHWPGLWGSQDKQNNERLRQEVWAAFEDLYLAGRVRAIGVSNFLVGHLEGLLSLCRVKPMVNQIEVSPYLQQRHIVQFCQQHDIVVQAWGPFGSGATGVLQDPVLKTVASAHGKNTGQVILRWLLQRNIAALPKSLSPERMKNNLNIFDFELTDEELKNIDDLDRGVSSVVTADDIA
jgi:diketogulonate reductase-like aldo/keto reductase